MSKSLRNMLVLTHREYLDTVKTKFFWISVLLAPIIFVAAAILVTVLSTSTKLQKYAVVDATGWAAETVRESMLRTDVSRFVTWLARSDATTIGMPEELLASIRTIAQTEQRGSLVAKTSGHIVGNLDEELSSYDELDRTVSQFSEWWTSNEEHIKTVGPDLLVHEYEEVDLGADDPAILNEKLHQGEISGYFVIADDVVNTNENLRFVSVRTGQRESQLQNHYERYLEPLIRNKRIEEVGISNEDYRWIQAPIRFNAQRATSAGENIRVTARDRATPYVPIAFVYVMWFIVFVGSTTLINSTVEEKNSKVVEVLLSTLSAAQMMYGKVIASGASILTMVAVWFVLIIGSLTLIPIYTSIPVSTGELLEVIKPIYFLKFGIYTLLSFFMLAPLMSAIGSTAASLKSAQTMITPVSIVMMVPLLVMFFIADDSTSPLAQVMTFIPIYTPFSLLMRMASPPAIWVELLAVGITVVTAYGINLVSARIFEKAILREGPTPTYRQMLALIRT